MSLGTPVQRWSRIFRSEETETGLSIWISGIFGMMESTQSKLNDVKVVSYYIHWRDWKEERCQRQMRFSLPPIKCSAAPTTVEHCFVVWTVLSDLITARSAVVGSWEELPNIWLTIAKNAFVGWALNFRVRMLLKGAITQLLSKRFTRTSCSDCASTKILTYVGFSVSE